MKDLTGRTAFITGRRSDGLPPDAAGQRVLRAIRDDEFFIFTHEEPRAWIEERHVRLMAAFDRVAAR